MEPKEDEKQIKGIQPGPHVEEFANALDNCLAPGLSLSEKRERVLDLPRKYHENAIRRLIQKRPKRMRDGNEDVDMDVDDSDAAKPDPMVLNEMRQLEREIQTWDLVRRLLPLRSAEAQPTSSLFTAKKKALHDLVDTDPILKERRAVLQWLQTNAASGPDIDELARELQQNADRGDIIAHGWLHTRSKIKLRKSMTAWPHLLDRQSPSVTTSHLNSDGAPLVTQLDPDAGTRQGRKLEPQDEYFERAIWLGCFEHLRRGSSLQTIREWCQERTEMWRAISMSGMLLPADGKEIMADAPPASLVLWRRMCLSLARGGGSDDYERAVYGLLSGDIASVEKIDSHLLSQSPPDTVSVLAQSFPSFDAIQFHGELEGVEKRLVTTLESQKSTRDEALEPNKALQASSSREISTDEPSLLLPSIHPTAWNFLNDKGDLVRHKFFGLEQHEGLRIACHIYVLIALLRQFDALEGKVQDQLTTSHWRSGQESIIAGYTDYLARANLKELIPLYCSILRSPRQYEVLSWNMIHEQNADRRMTQLKLIKRVGIDVLKFVETLAKLVFDKLDHTNDTFTAKESFSIIGEGPPTVRHGRGIKADFFGDDDAVISAKDEHVIRSLEWLLQVQVAWPEVLRIGVQVYKFFFRNTHLLAARRLMERVQFDAILQNVSEQEVDLGVFDDVDFWAQQLDQSGIASAVPEQVMTDARNYRELEHLARALDSLETMGSLMRLSKEAPPGDRTFWSGVGDAVKVMKDRMQPLLGSWLLTSIEGGDKELRELRQVYLPEAILAFVSGLHYAGNGLSRDNLLECMELAGTVAERESNLATAFVEAKRMRELVEAFTACSKALATAKGNKGATGSSSKKLRETGWSRDLWTVKQ
ncbi:nuclear pore protein [Hirsutella rhossiliensis]|uniref:Nuclear pore complex protein n=1 Tax=Hirsutella rhossiliensis TaxID=111463 RepID=A0A9P8SC85_9HYPO|nr:nuclear pore protein [Hirsutella rhossiliensis]KAH0957286.1 nuclear pore protein [Hirsutella rhossiliensis]